MAGASAGSYFGTPALYGVMQKVNVKNIFQNKLVNTKPYFSGRDFS